MDSLVDAQEADHRVDLEHRAADDCRSIVGRCPHGCGGAGCAQVDARSKSPRLVRRRRSATPPPENVSQRPAGWLESDPIREAVQAMEQAVQQLQTERTAEALPHEMAALNALLQAQAEARRREVLRQQAGGGQRLGRSGQDLSALFDKELQRQQQTNYETPPSAETVDKRPMRTTPVRPAPGSGAAAGGLEPAPGGACPLRELADQCSVSSRS